MKTETVISAFQGQVHSGKPFPSSIKMYNSSDISLAFPGTLTWFVYPLNQNIKELILSDVLEQEALDSLSAY